MTRISYFIGVLAAILSFTACSPDGPDQNSHTRIAADQLDEISAKARKARIGEIAYVLDIDLMPRTSDEGPDGFSGVSDVSFDLKSAGEPLNIDFGGGTVERVEVNGVDVRIAYNGGFITLPGDALVVGENNARITYSHGYSQDGTGLHRFVDPVDGRTYLYTYLWPYYANRLFPSFDQPDLKATYALSVRAPADWNVISSVRESLIEANGAARLWTFPVSEKFSTYIFSLHAGPYAVWEGQNVGENDIPIRLFARQSLAEFVPAEEWLDVTRSGLDYYAEYFDISYAFHKYDQLIVPDFLIGAMENVGAVTFAESYVPRGAPDRFFREARANTILHEMAHMWFGDLVTKVWWNDLWLNESFATYMAFLAVPNATEFSDAGHNFFLRNKRRGMAADSMVTTHPISVPVPSTDDFFSVFDAITYQKGASVLKQQAHYIGADNFQAGVSAYLKKHAYGNTRLADFIASLSEASGRDLVPWSDAWLGRAGVNGIEARYACEGGLISAFDILQTAPENLPTLRSQVLQVGLYGFEDGGGVATRAVLPVEISAAETPVDGAISQACPDMVFPNHGDWAYASVTLDDRTLAGLKAHLPGVEDPLLRSMYWHALAGMAGGGDLPISEFLDLVIDNLPQERNERVIGQVLGITTDLLRQLDRLSPDSDVTLAAYALKVEAMMQAMLADKETSVDARKLVLDAFIASARTNGGLQVLAFLNQIQDRYAGVFIDHDHRWAIIQRLNAMDYPGADALLADIAAADQSDYGQRMAITAAAGRAYEATKRQWLAKLLDEVEPLPLARARAVIVGLFPSHQGAIQAAMLDEVIAALPELGRTRDPYFLSSYAGTLLSGVCTVDSTAKLAAALEGDDTADMHPTIRKFLSEAHQRDAECVALRGRVE